MASLPENYRALIIGASGGIDSAIVQALKADPVVAVCFACHVGTVRFDVTDEVSVAEAAANLPGVLNALPPEKTGGFFAYDGSAIEW